QHAEDQAELDRRPGGAVVTRVPRGVAPEQVAQARDAGGHERDERHPGHRHVEEQDAAGLADELRGQRRGLEGAPDHGGEPQPKQPGGGSPFHGFHTTGKSIKPAVVTAPSYSRSCTRATPDSPAEKPPAKAARVSSTASSSSGRSTGNDSTAKSVPWPRAWAMIAATRVLPAASPKPPAGR